ncbi:MAG: PHP domain-containing protein, partial [Muribaculaceae bacterium]|nr:PHP domain-containing protein [Muribaculaceae bacterium]
MTEVLRNIIDSTDRYNFHAHTQFCDGRDSMEEIAAASRDAGLHHLGFTPHSPVPIESPCNMAKERVEDFYRECERLREIHSPEMKIYTSMEIDWLGHDWGPHIDWFQRQPLDYRLGSVHFVPNQEGVLLDCDGRFERFARYLKEGYGDDLRYVVEKYFEQVLMMLERGGFELLGHFDKIAANAAQAHPEIENQGCYEALI